MSVSVAISSYYMQVSGIKLIALLYVVTCSGACVKSYYEINSKGFFFFFFVILLPAYIRAILLSLLVTFTLLSGFKAI